MKQKIRRLCAGLVAVLLLTPTMPVALAVSAPPSTVEQTTVQATATGSAIQPTVEILYPSEGESTIAAGRDFYVIGKVDGLPEGDATLAVELYAAEETTPVRCVYTDKRNNTQGMYYQYDQLNQYLDDVSQLQYSYMPDLVYDPADPDSFADAWRKCYLGDSYFTALICGGVYDQDINLMDEEGTPYTPLAEGNYTIRVSIQRGNQICTQEKDIVLGVNENKLCARFSPSAQYNAVSAFAEENGLRMYNDPFAGYWSSADYIPDIAELELFCEILPKWHAGEYQEYSQGTTHVVLYNIEATSATQSVEIGTLNESGALANAKCYYYALGEPVLNLNGEQQASEILEMESGDTLQLVRVDAAAAGQADNTFDTTTSCDVLDSALGDGAAVLGQEGNIAVTGVVTPIQNDAADIVRNEDGSFTLNNSIAMVHYILKDASGKALETIESPVGLVRKFESGKDRTSLYEFSHVFDLSAYAEADNMSLEVYALDAKGNVVVGSEETLVLTQLGSKQPAPAQPVPVLWPLLVLVGCLGVVLCMTYFKNKKA